MEVKSTHPMLAHTSKKPAPVVPIPKPLYAIFPDGGANVDNFEMRGCDQITAHPDGTLRVWRGFNTIRRVDGSRPNVEMPYYPIQAVGMTGDEIERAIRVAVAMLSIPVQNRKARRATSH